MTDEDVLKSLFGRNYIRPAQNEGRPVALLSSSLYIIKQFTGREEDQELNNEFSIIECTFKELSSSPILFFYWPVYYTICI